MTRDEFISSFDSATFDPFAYTLYGGAIDRTQDKLNTIREAEKAIADVNKNSDAYIQSQYSRAVNRALEQIDTYQGKLDDFLANPAGYTSALRAQYKNIGLYNSRGDTSRAAKAQAKYDDLYAKTLASLEANVNKYQDAYQTALDNKDSAIQREIADSQATVDKYIGLIANDVMAGQNIVGDRLEDGLESIVKSLDRIDQLKSLQQEELDSTDGINKDVIQKFDTDITKEYNDVNQRYAKLVDDVGYYGAQLPDEIGNLADIRDFYANARAQAADENADISDILGRYADEGLPAQERQAFLEARDEGIDDNPDYLNSLINRLGLDTVSYTPISQQEDFLAAYEANPEAAPRVPPTLEGRAGVNPAEREAYIREQLDVGPQVMPEVQLGEFIEADLGDPIIYGYTGQDQLTREEATQAAYEAFNRYGFRPANLIFNEQKFNDIVDYYQKVGTEIGDRQFDGVIGTQLQATNGPAGLSIIQANEIAKQISAFSNLGYFEDAEGNRLENPLAELTERIYEQGYEPVISKLKENGLAIVNPVSDKVIDPDVAGRFVDQLTQASGRSTNSGIRQNWINATLRNGFEDTLKSWEEANGNSFLTTDVTKFINENNAALQSLRDTGETQLGTNIDKILAGQRLSPIVPLSITPEQAFDQLVGDLNLKYTDEQKQDWIDIFNRLGMDAGVLEFNQANNPYDLSVKTPYLYEQRTQPFGTTSPTEPLLNREEPTLGTTGAPELPGQSTELGVPVERGEVTPAAGLSAITNAYPTTLPTTGVPTSGVPAGFQTSTYQPAPYTPPPLLAQAPARPTLTPTQELIGAPGIDRGVPVPMQALTPEQVGSTFVPPTQEDYYAFFGYTPEQLNAAQYLAELEGAPRAGIAAQTVPVLPPAVTGAPTEMKEGGMPQDAQRLASKGRGGDSTLVHMAPEEVAGLQALARQNGTSLTINPETGLPEALKLRDILGPIAVVAGTVLSGGTLGPGLLSLAYGGGYALGSGSIEKGIAAGLSAYGISNLAAGAATAVTGTEIPGFALPTPAPGGAEVGTAMGGVQTGANLADYGDIASTASTGVSVPEPTMFDKLGTALSGPGTVPTTLNSAYMKGFLPASMGMSLNEQIAQNEAYQNYMNQVNQLNEEERKKNRQLFESTLGSVPLQYARKGGLMRLAGGGMTYAEGGGTTDVTNEPRMVKGTGDGMSDSVPATIEGVQEARLANDEFVVPADVVADIGNGSSSAGAQQLYDMMDRVRQARHGTTEQPPEIDVRKLMPA